MSSDIAIIGGAGFLGSALQKMLKASSIPHSIFDIHGHDVEGIHYLDVRNFDPEEFIGCRVLINLAAEHRDDVYPLEKYYETNVEGAQRICEAAVRSGVNSIIFTSSVAVYGFTGPNADESTPANPFNEYGRTKHLAEQVYKKWQEDDPDNRSLLILRPTVIFGPGNRGNVYNLLRQIKSKKFVMLGDGKNIKSMAYVENVAKFLAQSLYFAPGVHIYNYVDKPDLDMNSLVKLVRLKLFNKNDVGVRLPGVLGIILGHMFDTIAKLIDKPLPISSIRVKKFMATTQFSSAIDQAEFTPDFTLADGLEKTLDCDFFEGSTDDKTELVE